MAATPPSERYMAPHVRADLRRKLVLVAGPRQVGKTTLALGLLGAKAGEEHPGYLNWDIPEHRTRILRGEIPSHPRLVVFDEIHKYARWRGLLKGFYDRYYPRRRALVTGSARLDLYRKGGDSLQGRYHLHRLHPFSLREIASRPTRNDVDALLRFGGFPEPLLAGDDRTWRRWQLEYHHRVLGQDLRELERVHEVSLIELLAEALPDRVGSPLSLQSLREDLGVSHDAVRRWVTILENLYLCFRISPYGSPRIRAVKKEQKLYLWDWSRVREPGPRFENLVACQLLKYCHFREDSEGHRMELRFLRDTDRREVDFVVLEDRRPAFAVECKTGETRVSPHARYFRARTPIRRFFQVHLGERDFGDADADVRVLPFHRFVHELSLP
jgi:hypothetical protein